MVCPRMIWILGKYTFSNEAGLFLLTQLVVAGRK